MTATVPTSFQISGLQSTETSTRDLSYALHPSGCQPQHGRAEFNFEFCWMGHFYSPLVWPTQGELAIPAGTLETGCCRALHSSPTGRPWARLELYLGFLLSGEVEIAKCSPSSGTSQTNTGSFQRALCV